VHPCAGSERLFVERPPFRSPSGRRYKHVARFKVVERSALLARVRRKWPGRALEDFDYIVGIQEQKVRTSGNSQLKGSTSVCSTQILHDLDSACVQTQTFSRSLHAGPPDDNSLANGWEYYSAEDRKRVDEAGSTERASKIGGYTRFVAHRHQ